MATTTGSTLGTAGYEQIQALISSLTTYEGRKVSLPDIDRLAVERDLVAVTSASVALISEAMKSQLDRVQGLSILENLFDALIDQGVIDNGAENAPTADSVVLNAVIELMFKNLKQLDGADNDALVNGLLGTLNGLTWYLTDSETADEAYARSTAGDGVWAEDRAEGSQVIDLAYLDAAAIYARVQQSAVWEALEQAGVAPITENSTLEEISTTLERVNSTEQSVASFADYFAHAMVGLERLSTDDYAEGQNVTDLVPDALAFFLDDNGNIAFTMHAVSPYELGANDVFMPPWMTSYNPTGQESMGAAVMHQEVRRSGGGDADVSVSYVGPVYQGSTGPVTMIESLYFAIDSDPAFKEYLLNEYNLTDPSAVSTDVPEGIVYHDPTATLTIGEGHSGPVDAVNNDEYKIQPPRMRAMQAFVEAAFQEMNGLGVTTEDLVKATGGTFLEGIFGVVADTPPDDWEADLATVTGALGLSADLDMFQDLTTLNAAFGTMTLYEIEAWIESALAGGAIGPDDGSGTTRSAVPFLDEFTYRYGSGPDYDAILTHVRNDMGSLKDLSVDAFLSNAKLTRENLSSTTQTLLFDVKNEQAKLEGAIELLNSTAEDIKNAMRDLFSNW